MRYSKGICWIGDCRIPFVDDGDMMKPTIATRDEFNDYKKTEGRKNIRQGGGFIKQSNQQGRFTPNLLVCDDMLNDGIKPNKGHRAKSKVTGYGEFGGGKSEYHGIGEYMEVDSKSRYYDLDKWFDKVIDEIQ
jgi:hypothetical protein